MLGSEAGGREESQHGPRGVLSPSGRRPLRAQEGCLACGRIPHVLRIHGNFLRMVK